MDHYRIFFLNSSGRIESFETLELEDDAVAVTMAELLYDALSEAYRGYELWLGGRLISTRSKPVSSNACQRSRLRCNRPCLSERSTFEIAELP
jgi:hypothetical protein